MVSILSTATSGMSHHARALDVVANNVANISTDGFKASRVLSEGTPEVAPADGGRKGVAQTTIDRDFNAASAIPGGPLQFTIQDDAFYAVLDFDGTTVYSRTGNLQLDRDGNILAVGGRLLEPAIALPADHSAPAVTAAGVVTAIDPDGNQVDIGQLQFFRFINPYGLETNGEGLFVVTENSGAPIAGEPGQGDFRELLPATIEGSNVELVLQFTSMMTAQRAYQASARAFRVGDEMLELATDVAQ
jgi:flagellar basal-body rod protein FlgG